MYVLKTNLANKSNYGAKRSTLAIKYIVVHYTANDGDTDENNGKYFKNNIVSASSHYFVDSDSVTQSVPDDYVAYSVGGKKYSNCSTTGGGKFYGKCTNTNSLNIEICDDVKNGVIYPSAQTIKNAIELTKQKMKEYNVPASNVIRHFDVNGKSCPAYWCGSEEKDTKWKTEFWNELTFSPSSSTPKPVSKPTQPAQTSQKVNVTYAVKTKDGKILPEVTNLDDYAGIENKEIIGVAIKVDKGDIKYQVHIKGGKWLPYVTGYNWNDHNNGYAGNGKVIDAIRVYYSTPSDLAKSSGYKKAQYRVSPIGNTSYYSWQLDDEIDNSMDGYAGAIGKAIDKFQIVIG